MESPLAGNQAARKRVVVVPFVRYQNGLMPTGVEILHAIPVILSLILIEGLLSVDNALAIASMASHLPEKQQKLALRLGIIGAYVFRGISLALVAWIQSNLWIKYFGSGYLIYLMCSHLTSHQNEGDDIKKIAPRGLWMTVASIELMDLSLSIDNVIAAVALSDQLWVIVTGVFIGILALRLLAGYAIGLIKKFPILGPTAFLLVGYVGFLLIFEMTTHIHLGAIGKFSGICLIVLISIYYERVPFIRTIFRPLVRLSHYPMLAFARAVEALSWPVTFLFGKLIHRAT